MDGGAGLAIGGLGSILGAASSAQAQKTNNDIALMNYYSQEQQQYAEQQQAQQVEADRKQQYSDTQEGYTDQYGNRVHFVPGQGWVTDVTDAQKAIQQQQQKLQTDQTGEAEKKLNVDAPIQRAAMKQTALTQQEQSHLADTFMREIAGHIPDDPQNAKAIAAGEALKAINQGLDNAQATAGAEALASGDFGTDNQSRTYDKIAGNRVPLLAAAFKAADDARSQTFSDDSSYLNSKANLANIFGGASKGQLVGSTYSPVGTDTQVDPQLAGLATSFSGMTNADANNMGTALLGALSQPAPQFDYMQPNNGLANAFTSFGNSLTSYQNNAASQDYKNRVLASLGGSGSSTSAITF